MNRHASLLTPLLFLAIVFVLPISVTSQETEPAAKIDGTAAGWKELTFADFVNVNCKEDTWRFENGVIICNGNCNGGLRSTEQYTNFEMVMQWKHLRQSADQTLLNT